MKPSEKEIKYIRASERINALIEGETDEISVMATIVCELHHEFEQFHWTGFYRRTEADLLKIGPYQGGHGCLSIEFSRGVCGKAAREGLTQVVEDVHELPYHIACSSTTISEIVVPVFDRNRNLRAVLDIDSNDPSAFTELDASYLEKMCTCLQKCYDLT